MNYLAHAYLSFRQPELLLGNLISDFVKGQRKYAFPQEVQKGIALHRSIDFYTDYHEATQAIKHIFRPDYRLYGGAFADIIYDHFLARDESVFPGNALQEFAGWVYESLAAFEPLFPDRFRRMYPYMKKDNWLFNYQYVEGIEKSFGGLVYRALYIQESATACHLFEKHYTLFQDCYKQFFPDLTRHTVTALMELNQSFSTKGS